jgi:L-threonylcarbamoyladenylate synthase
VLPAPNPQIMLPDAAALQTAVALLQAGHCVAFPTETVYGLGVDATQDQAVAALYALKGRPSFNPLIIHVADVAQLEGLVVLSPLAQLAAQRFWPGALTLILPAAPTCPVALLARAGLPSVAVRIPDHPVALALLRAVGRPLAAPSANRSGGLSPTTPLHVAHSLGVGVPLILAGGKTVLGVESTILDLTTPQPVVRRYGGVSLEQLSAGLGQPVRYQASVADATPTAPGQLSSHYAPQKPVRLNVTTAQADEAFLLFGAELGLRGGAVRLNLSPTGDLYAAAANLFAMLHVLDATGCSAIAVAAIPPLGLGLAINDRLQRAAAPR